MESTKDLMVGDIVRVVSRGTHNWIPSMHGWVGHTAEVKKVDNNRSVLLWKSGSGATGQWSFRAENIELEKPILTAPDVSSLAHYAASGIQPIAYMLANYSIAEFEGYLKGNVVKYISRYPNKNGVEDLKKAQIYLQWLVELKSTGTIVIKQ